MLIRLLPRIASPSCRQSLISVRCASQTTQVRRDASPLQVTHVIFDLDGLLIDSESIFVDVNKRIMSRYGKEYTTELKRLTMGMSQRPGVELCLDKVGLTGKVSVDEYIERYNALLPEMLPDCALMPGAMRFLRHLAKHDVPRAICTGSPLSECDVKLIKHREIVDLIPLWVYGGDPEIRNGKPAPDCFLLTKERFPQKAGSARNIAVFEDSQNGVRAAVAAGMQAVMVPDQRFFSGPSEDVKDRVAMVLDNLDELKPETLGLPPFDD